MTPLQKSKITECLSMLAGFPVRWYSDPQGFEGDLSATVTITGKRYPALPITRRDDTGTEYDQTDIYDLNVVVEGLDPDAVTSAVADITRRLEAPNYGPVTAYEAFGVAFVPGATTTGTVPYASNAAEMYGEAVQLQVCTGSSFKDTSLDGSATIAQVKITGTLDGAAVPDLTIPESI